MIHFTVWIAVDESIIKQVTPSFFLLQGLQKD